MQTARKTPTTTSTSTGVAPAGDETTSEEPRGTSNRSTTPASTQFQEFIGSQWADRVDELPAPREQARYAAERRARVSAAFPGRRVVINAGALKQRSNDTDYPFRAHSA
ncbi:MAG: aminopeptidase P N-terminal domain-containing protein, partial [Mycetocola sp.]